MRNPLHRFVFWKYFVTFAYRERLWARARRRGCFCREQGGYVLLTNNRKDENTAFYDT